MHLDEDIVNVIFSESGSMLPGSVLLGGSQTTADKEEKAQSSSQGSSTENTSASDEAYVRKVRRAADVTVIVMIYGRRRGTLSQPINR